MIFCEAMSDIQPYDSIQCPVVIDSYLLFGRHWFCGWKLLISCWWVCGWSFVCSGKNQTESICNNRCTDSFLLSAACVSCFDTNDLEKRLGPWRGPCKIAWNLVETNIHTSHLVFSRLPEFRPIVSYDFSWPIHWDEVEAFTLQKNCVVLGLGSPTWWLIPLSKWVITPVINGISRVIPLITGVITHLLSGMSHQVEFSNGHILRQTNKQTARLPARLGISNWTLDPVSRWRHWLKEWLFTSCVTWFLTLIHYKYAIYTTNPLNQVGLSCFIIVYNPH